MRKIHFYLYFVAVLFSQQLFAQQDQQQEQNLPDGVMATRGEGVVTRQIFDAKMHRIPQKDRAAVLRSTNRTQKIMADLLLTSQLKAAAEAAGFDEGDIQYRMQLAAETELANAWLDHYVDSQPPADYQAMAYEYYLLNKDKIVTEPSIDVTHLLVSKENRTPEELVAQAQEFLDQVLADPSTFEDLITSRSEDPSASSNKGHFKGVKKGDMVKAFEDAAFALENPGDFSGLVKSNYGIHIIRLDKKTPSRVRSFEEVEDQLVAQQKKTHRDQVKYTYLTELGSKPWQVSEKELELMVERYSEQEKALMESKKEKSE